MMADFLFIMQSKLDVLFVFFHQERHCIDPTLRYWRTDFRFELCKEGREGKILCIESQ